MCTSGCLGTQEKDVAMYHRSLGGAALLLQLLREIGLGGSSVEGAALRKCSCILS